jgi:hypothetical protein
MIDVRGFYDLHLHSGPAPFARIGDSADIALWCAEAGMAGIVVKSHFESTVSKVHHARRAVAARFPDFRIYAGIALNRGVGGVNPGAVDLALQQGAKIVWLPTLDASNHVAQFGAAGSYGFAGMTVGGKRRTERHYAVIDANGRLTDDAREVIDLVADYDAVLATGHVSPAEIAASVDYALSRGLTRIVVTHPELRTPGLDIPAMVEFARAGCTLEFCAVNLFPMFHCLTLDGLIAAIEAVTPAHAILSSDGGQPFHPRPHECLRVVVQGLAEKGVPAETLRTLCVTNPERLLGLCGQSAAGVPS